MLELNLSLAACMPDVPPYDPSRVEDAAISGPCGQTLCGEHPAQYGRLT